MPIERQPPPIEQIAQRLAARMARDGIRIERNPSPALLPKDEDRRQRSLRSCHLPAEPKPRQAPPRDSGAYVPEMAARIEDDPNLTDGARRCARKLAEYIYRKNRDRPRRRNHRHLPDARAWQVPPHRAALSASA